MSSNTEDLTELKATQTIELLRSGRLKPSVSVEFYLDRIAQYNAIVNALCYVSERTSRTRASQLEQQIERSQEALLYGLTFSAKSHLAVKDMPTVAGTEHGYVASSPHTCSAVQFLLDQGAICLGKGNMPEYGKSYYTENLLYGRTCNPFNPAYSPGGSSGGDAAAVATGLVDFALTSDTGGSTRVPASLCGLFGLHTTPGTVSNAGNKIPGFFAPLSRSLGPIAKSIDDIQLLHSVLARYTPADPFSASNAVDNCSATRNSFLWLQQMNGVDCTPPIAKALREAISRLEALNYTATQRCPEVFSQAIEPFVILVGQASFVQEDLVDSACDEVRDLSRESPSTKALRKRIAEELPALSAEAILWQMHRVYELRSQLGALFAEYDFVLAPVAATNAIESGTNGIQVNGQQLRGEHVFQFSFCANVLGLPALTFPVGLDQDGFPIGLQLIGPRFSESRLIELVKRMGYENRLIPPEIAAGS